MNSGPTRSRMQSERGYGRSPSMQCGLAAQDLSDRIQLIGMSRRPIALYLACEAIVQRDRSRLLPRFVCQEKFGLRQHRF
jgi:hypothetical protein